MIKYICKTCGTEFYSYNKNRKTCSVACRLEFISANMKGKRPRNLKSLIEKGKKYRYKGGVSHGTKLSIDRDVLVDLYEYQDKSISETSYLLNVSRTTVHNYLVEYDIPRKDQGFQEGNDVQVGEKHYNWKGGISCEPYCDVWLDKDFKESIKERDGYKCQNHDCWRTSNRLMVHHIDYNKKNCKPENLITLCGSCNSRANKNRDQMTIFYQNILKVNV